MSAEVRERKKEKALDKLCLAVETADPTKIRGAAKRCYKLGVLDDIFPPTQESNPLHRLIERHEHDLIVDLLECKASPDVPDNEGFTPLFLAMKNLDEEGNLDTFQLLLESHADPNLHANDVGPLTQAVRDNNIDIVHYLVQHKVDVMEDDRLPFREACKANQVQIGEIILERVLEGDGGCPATLACQNAVNCRVDDDPEYHCLIHQAVINSSVDLLDLLLQYKANVHQKDHMDRTALHYCGMGKTDNVEIAEILISKKANCHQEDKKFWTPVMLACKMASKDMYLYFHSLQEGDPVFDRFAQAVDNGTNIPSSTASLLSDPEESRRNSKQSRRDSKNSQMTNPI